MPANQNHHAAPGDQALAILDAAADAGERDGIEEFAEAVRQPDTLPNATNDPAPPVRYATAASYRKGVEIPLSNDEWVRLRPVSLMTMVRKGTLPNSLIGAAHRMLSNQGRQQKADAPQDPQVARESLALQDYLITRLVTSMKVVMSDPDQCADDEVSVDEMFEGDKNRIVAFAMQGQKALADFR